MPFLDPKIFDQSVYESNKYVERRDDIGRVLLSAPTQAQEPAEGSRAEWSVRKVFSDLAAHWSSTTSGTQKSSPIGKLFPTCS